MNLKQAFEEFKQFPPATQLVLIVFALIMMVLLVIFPTAGTSIMTFLVALKMLTTQ